MLKSHVIKWQGLMALLAAVSAPGQNMVNFSNAGIQVNAPFFDSAGVPLSGTNYLVQLYAGAESGALSAFGPTIPFLSGSDAGYFLGGYVPLPEYIVRVDCGPTWAQARAWEAAGGATFEQAALRGYWTGISTVIYLPSTGGCIGGVPFPIPGMVGLQYPGLSVIVSQPQNQRIRPGERAQLRVVVSGGVALFYQWFQVASGNTNSSIPGATNAIYAPPTPSTNTSFWVQVTSSAGSVDSAIATVWLVPAMPGRLDVQMISSRPQLTIHGTVGTTVQLQHNADLNPAHWTPLTNLWQSVDPIIFTDATAANVSARFYRLSLP